ncbi:hypothetical protein [Haloferula sp.]|uniref:hypothetical protein n=1 Tax=Haloferula sp. TaxID=2497595 RepID=UPI00329FE9A8
MDDVELPLKPDEPMFVGTQEALASHRDVERKSTQRWSKQPLSPGKTKDGFDVQVWRRVVEKDGLGWTRGKIPKKSFVSGRTEADDEANQSISL